jgi:serine/threonine protein phosphatase PrpC
MNPNIAPNETDSLKQKEFLLVGVWHESKVGDPALNEDVFATTDNGLFLADGATDKTGFAYPSGKSGGRSLAEIAVAVAAASDKNGYELADEINAAIMEFYRQNNPAALEDSSMRAATTLAAVRLLGDKIAVTQIGDTNIRLTMKDDSTHILTNDRLVDTENAHTRSRHIASGLEAFRNSNQREPNEDEHKEIVASGRAVIMDRLSTQHRFQNNKQDEQYGYGILDGLAVPRYYTSGKTTDYVKTFEFPADDVASVEIASDGFYGEFPAEVTVEAYKNLLQQIHQTDPDKHLRYLSTKPRDDASVVIARLSA